MNKSPAFQALEDCNVEMCRLSGAGRGADTTREAIAAYEQLFTARRDTIRALIDAAKVAPDYSARRFYIAGMEARFV